MMSHLQQQKRSTAYRGVLSQIEALNTHLIVLDRPRIALPAMARYLILEIQDLLPHIDIRDEDKKAIGYYVRKAKMFCERYFEHVHLPEQPSILPLKLPCDSGELLREHEFLFQQYVGLRLRLDRYW